MTEVLEHQYEAFEYQIHTCSEDYHHHIITGPNNVSWPFWSHEAALKMLEHLHLIIGPSISHEEKQKIQKLHLVINCLAYIQKSDKLGRFGKLRMPRKFLYRESSIAEMWVELFTNKEPKAYCIDQTIMGTFAMPLYCDFVRRKEQRPSGALSKQGLDELADAVVEPLSIKDLGIELTLSS